MQTLSFLASRDELQSRKVKLDYEEVGACQKEVLTIWDKKLLNCRAKIRCDMEDIHTSLKEGILDHLNHLFFFFLKSFRDCFDSSSVSIIFSLSLPIKKKESSLFPPVVSDYVGRNVVLTAVLSLRR